MCALDALMFMNGEFGIEADNNENNITIVVADDCKDNLMFISFVLDNLNLKYYLACDGKAAIDLVRQQKPNLVLLDVVMPNLSGIDANILIKDNKSTSHIPTIAITALSESKHITTIQNAGFDDYLIKPFMIEELEIKLKYFLEID